MHLTSAAPSTTTTDLPVSTTAVFISNLKAFTHLNTRHDVAVVILAGVGRSFCAGADLKRPAPATLPLTTNDQLRLDARGGMPFS